MDENSPNPYASANSLPAAIGPRRPVGTLILALLLLLGGMALGVGGVIRLVERWSTAGPPPSIRAAVPFVHLGIVAVASVAASAGLLSGRRWGWWLAMALCYLLLVSFVLLPIVRFGINDRPLRLIFTAVALLLGGLYLHRKNVLEYFARTGMQHWYLHVAFFVLAAVFVFGLQLL
jgi:hypothetical protein